MMLITSRAFLLLNLLSTWPMGRLVVSAFDAALLHRAASVRATMMPHDLPPPNPLPKDLFFPSSFVQSDQKINETRVVKRRGFCNWIIPGRIMVGQYPGQNPEVDGPSSTEVKAHLTTLLKDANVKMFVSLQSEIPPQDDYQRWREQRGQVYLPDLTSRLQFPRPFVHYAPIVESILSQSNHDSTTSTSSSHQHVRQCQYLHWPIEDLSIPENSQSLNELLLRILTALDEHQQDEDGTAAAPAAVYIHCWGGRGRVGLTASCLLSLLFPELDAPTILGWIQAGYDTREGAENMPTALSKSPQTESQRQFVRNFVKQRRKKQHLQQTK
ncbi:protein-tyrosine phosphatase [Nitzschia inconspicua]|uniref:Protein-tyrosine phosphatase n=1 Tax=Nitzschia inconspicua TaxID=303405 RepID=A0A9K3KVG8_9STRA|nr:protein-tyrosine phosphatase [Nitzschia inconspicua]